MRQPSAVPSTRTGRSGSVTFRMRVPPSPVTTAYARPPGHPNASTLFPHALANHPRSDMEPARTGRWGSATSTTRTTPESPTTTRWGRPSGASKAATSVRLPTPGSSKMACAPPTTTPMPPAAWAAWPPATAATAAKATRHPAEGPSQGDDPTRMLRRRPIYLLGWAGRATRPGMAAAGQLRGYRDRNPYLRMRQPSKAVRDGRPSRRPFLKGSTRQGRPRTARGRTARPNRRPAGRRQARSPAIHPRVPIRTAGPGHCHVPQPHRHPNLMVASPDRHLMRIPPAGSPARLPMRRPA